MKVWGLSTAQIETALAAWDLETLNMHRINGKCVTLRIVPVSSRSLYARHTAESPYGGGRRVRACCFHGFRDGILALFAAGATRVKSTQTDVRTSDAFRSQLYDLYHVNAGSMYNPQEFGELCECATGGDNYITGAAYLASYLPIS